MEEKVTTLKDVAKKSGVSRGTVDRVMHNRPGVSLENVLKVRKAIEELGYEPNVNASVLATRKPRLIALLMPSFEGGEYWEKMHQGFVNGCEGSRHLNFLGRHFEYDPLDLDSFHKACDELLEAEPSGVVLSPFFIEDILAFTKVLHSRGIPYVYVDSRLDDPNYLAYFGVPMYKSGYLCASLLTVGRKQEQMKEVLVVRILRDNARKADPTLQRRMGFYEYMNEHFPKCTIHSVFIDHRDKEGITRALDSFFEEHPDLSHVVMFNSRIYLIDEYLKSHPKDDLRVVGFDALKANIRMLSEGRVEFLITQHIDIQAQRAVETLVGYSLKGKPLEKKENHMHMDILTALNCEDY